MYWFRIIDFNNYYLFNETKLQYKHDKNHIIVSCIVSKYNKRNHAYIITKLLQK